MTEQPTAPTAAPQREYAAFISYRHLDNREPGRQWATWLHQELERYEVPADLIGKLNKRGELIPASLYPVFRDEEEAEADSDLQGNIAAALERSRMLIVLCSPRSATSTLVDFEVRTFKELGREGRVLALVLEGEPCIKDDETRQKLPGLEASRECLPLSLRRGVGREDGSLDWNAPTQPIAADVRPLGGTEMGYTSPGAYAEFLARRPGLGEKQRREMVAAYDRRLDQARLKILAGVLGVELGVLTQRDKAWQLRIAREKARALRRWLFLVGGLAIAAIAAGFFAWFKQKEAEEQRNLARASEALALHNLELARNIRDRSQDLNLFFIGDLHKRLRALGRLDLLDEAARRVVAYHEQIPAELAREPGMLRARAMAMDYSGQIALSKGDAVTAVERLRASHDAWSKMVTSGVGGSAALEGFAISSRMLGDALKSSGHHAESLENYRQGIEALDRLRPIGEQGAALLKRLRSKLLVAQGNAHYRQGDHVTALQDLDSAAALANQSVETLPRDRASWEQVVEAFVNLAQHYTRIEDYPAALKQAQAAVQAGETLVELDIENAGGWSFAAQCYGVLLMAQSSTKDWINAIETAEKQLSWRKRIFQRDENNPSAEADVAIAHDDLGYILTYNANAEQAVIHFSEAVKILAGLIQRFPSRNDWRRDLALVFKRRADLAFKIEAWELALQDYENSLRMRRLLANAAPGDVDARTTLANALTAKGETLWKMARTADAESTFKEGIAVLQAAPPVPMDHPEVAARLQGLRAALEDLKNGTFGTQARK